MPGWGWAEEQGSLPVKAGLGGGPRVRFGAELVAYACRIHPGLALRERSALWVEIGEVSACM